jgi:hypothetical protein
MNPISGLFQSRKFWLLVLDVVLGIATYFVNKYAAPDIAGDVKFVFASLQPMFVAVIVGIFAEDNAERKMKSSIRDSELSWEYYKVQEEKAKTESEGVQ